MTAQYTVGIDLGTTNSVLAFAALYQDNPEVSVLLVPQLTGPSSVESLETLPSFMYLPAKEEVQSGALALPWDAGRTFAVGEWCRRQAAEAPQRTVAAAKSWLCHSLVDRRAAILPWNAPAEVDKVSPVLASQHYLEHLVECWEQTFPDAPLREQVVVLTVPASFDASARELTRAAALQAGLPEAFILLEEPQAALYAWLADRGERWRALLKPDDVLLVCDVGGGTTDFTLIRVIEEKGSLALKREAVGDHILAGGDNMDLTLAHIAAAKLKEQGADLDPWQTVALWHACRQAKEKLLSPGAKENLSAQVAVMGRGRKLIGGSLKTELNEGDIQQLLDGFFPLCDLSAKAQKRRASGFREAGLPFAADPAITRHLAEFLSSHGMLGGNDAPTHVLFNGGVFKAKIFRDRITSVLSHWYASKPAVGLEGNQDLDHAVARGAAYYAFAKQGKGIRIRGGAPRSYYIGMETSGPAIPGAPRPLQALCVAAMGMEEGTSVQVPGAEIGLVVGQSERFRFFSSNRLKDDVPGKIRPVSPEELTETDSLEMTLSEEGVAKENSPLAADYLPVRLETKITELGMLELWCVEPRGAQKWKFEFSVRDDAQ